MKKIVNLIWLILVVLTVVRGESLTYQFPENFSFAGQNVPLDYLDVRERIVKIYNNLLYDRRGFLLNLYQKYKYYIPQGKQILREANLSEDFVYIALAESQLNMRVASSAKALGPWQFIKSTAQKYGLTVNKNLDERKDFAKATKAAAKFIEYLINSNVTKGDVFLVLACYNNGVAAVNKMLINQKQASFWACISNSETADYVPRVLVYKEIFSHPEKYGLTKDNLINLDYLTETEKFVLNISAKNLTFSDLATFLGISYRQFYQINPQLRHRSYKKGGLFKKYTSVEINIPKNKTKDLVDSLTFHKYFSKNEDLVAIDKGDYLVHTVKEATLGEIAFKYKKNWKQIAKDNHLDMKKMKNGTKVPVIRQGMKLKIYK